MSQSPDIAVLRTPGGSRALPLVRVFISGYACRHGLSVDRLDDVQLAVESLLAEEREEAGELVLEMSFAGDVLTLRLDGLRNQSVRVALLESGEFRPSADCPLDVRVLLESLVDGFRVADGGSASFELEMQKRTS